MGTYLRALIVGLATVFLLAAGTAAADGQVVFGTVELVEGSITVQLPDGSSKSPAVGDWILRGSTIVTGVDGELQLATEDSGYIAVRADTQLRVDDYRAEGGDEDRMALSLLKGTFRAITGWIGRFNRDSYSITTPTATLGIRGTDHEPAFVTEQDAARLGEEAGTYDKVNDGGSYIQTASGRTELAPHQSGFASVHSGAAPRLLDHAPRFYHASRNEKRIIQRRGELRRGMQQQHAAKRRAWVQQHPQARRPGAGRPHPPDNRRAGKPRRAAAAKPPAESAEAPPARRQGARRTRRR